MPVIYRPTAKFVPAIVEGTPTSLRKSPNTDGDNPMANQLRGDRIDGVANPAPYINKSPLTDFNTRATRYAPGHYPGSMNTTGFGVVGLDPDDPETLT